MNDAGSCPWCFADIQFMWTKTVFVVKDGRALAPAWGLDEESKLPDGMYARCPTCREEFEMEVSSGRPL